MMSILSTFLCALLIGCGQSESAKSPRGDADANGTHRTAGRETTDTPDHGGDVRDSAAHAERLSRVSDTILDCFKRKDFHALARFVYPKWGVRFSPYGYIDTVNDLDLDGDALKLLADNRMSMNWGSYDAVDDSIYLSLADYIDRFVYDRDYITMERAVNASLRGPTTTPDNQADVYPGLDYVSFRFPGDDPAFDGMDWSGLRLIYRTEFEQIYLVGVVHDQWTI